MMLDIILALVRHVVTAGGVAVWLNAHGSGDQLEKLLGAISVLISILWSVWHKKAVAAITSQPTAQVGATDPLAKVFTSNIQKVVPFVVLVFLSSSVLAQSNNLQVTPLMLANLSGIQGILTNMVEEGGASVALRQPTSHFQPSVSEAYPAVRVTWWKIKETVCAVHSDTITVDGQTEDEVGIGFNTEKRVTPSPVNLAIGTVSPVAHHGIFVNVVFGTTRLFQGKVDGDHTRLQVGGYVTF